MTNQPTNDNTQQNKALPFAAKEGFTAIPNAIFFIYMSHPNFNGNDLLVYAYLLKNHNKEIGYAFPSIIKMAQELNLGKSTVERSITRLEKVGLINIVFNKLYGNNNYYFNKPIETIVAFEKAFPEVVDYRRKQSEKWAERIAINQLHREQYEQKRRRKQ